MMGDDSQLGKLIYSRFSSYLRSKYTLNPVALRVVVRGKNIFYQKMAVFLGGYHMYYMYF